jgi:hypothetical protein
VEGQSQFPLPIDPADLEGFSRNPQETYPSPRRRKGGAKPASRTTVTRVRDVDGRASSSRSGGFDSRPAGGTPEPAQRPFSTARTDFFSGLSHFLPITWRLQAEPEIGLGR